MKQVLPYFFARVSYDHLRATWGIRIALPSPPGYIIPHPHLHNTFILEVAKQEIRPTLPGWKQVKKLIRNLIVETTRLRPDIRTGFQGLYKDVSQMLRRISVRGYRSFDWTNCDQQRWLNRYCTHCKQQRKGQGNF